MKIAYTISGIFNSGGMERILIQKANYLADVLGYDVTIITTDQENRASFFPVSSKIRQKDLGINYYMAKQSKFWQLKKIILKYKHKRELTKFLNEANFDICISLMDFDFSFLHSIKDGSKKIVESHFSRYAKVIASTNPIMKRLQSFRTIIRKKILKKYSTFVVLTEKDKLQWQPLNNISVIPNFINSYPSQFCDVCSHRIISVGRYDYQKGFDMLLSAWAKVQNEMPDWELVIFGGGDKSPYETQISREQLQRVRLESSTKDIGHEYQTSSIYVLSSRYEGLPMVLLEAMSYGLPIISFDCACGPSDILTPDFGKLVPREDIDKLAENMLAVAKDNKWREDASKNAILHSKQFSIANIMTRWDRMFKSL